jgi:two-component system, LytTR family, response regulator LytT
MLYRTLIVEDEPAEAQHLTELLRRYGQAHGHEFVITWHDSAIEMLEDHGHYDLSLLDIQMAGINGMEAAALLRTYDDQIPIIFVTNLAKYAVKGYEVGACGFIVKPATYGNLTLALERALRTVTQNAGRTVTIPTESGLRVVPLRQIAYIEVMKHKLTYHIVGEEPVDARGSLVQLEEDLADAPVVRISKSCLANMDQISMLRSAEMQMANGDCLRISRTHKRNVVDKVTDYLGGRR